MVFDLPEPAATIRTIRAEELADMAGLRREMILEIDAADYDELHPGWRERFIAFFRDRLAIAQGQFYVAEVGGAIVGTAAVYLPATHRSEIVLRRSAYVCDVYVVPQWRRRGIARTLTQAAVDWAKENGCEVVRLRTSRMGRPIYEALGFKPSDEMELRLQEQAARGGKARTPT
jgi:GNAT superfamily N-acetyltransferase